MQTLFHLHYNDDEGVWLSSWRFPVILYCQWLAWCGVSGTQVITIGLRQQPSLSKETQHIEIMLRADKSGELKRCSSSCKARRIDQIKAGLSTVIHGKYTVTDNQSPPVLWPWVFLFGTWQECFQRLRNAGKPVFRIYWRDWHKPISLKLNIYHFEPQNFGGATNN